MEIEVKPEPPKIQFTATEFARAIMEGKATDLNGNVHDFLKEEVLFDSGYYISNLKVDEDIHLHDIGFLQLINISNCHFKKIEIFGCDFKYDFILMNNNIQDLYIGGDSDFQSALSISTCLIHEDLQIDYINVARNVAISGNTIKLNFLIFDSVFQSDLTITGLNIAGICWMKGQILKGIFRFLKISISGYLLVEDTLVENHLSFLWNIIDGDCTFKESTFNLDAYFTEIEVGKQFQFNRSKVLGSAQFRQGKVNHFFLPSIEAGATLKILGTEFRKIETEENFSNQGYMQWNNLTLNEDAIIEISNAIMGKWDIVSCDFSKTQMIIFSSKITDAFYTNSHFPQTLSTTARLVDKENEQDVLRDGYNQLKTLAQKQNDRKSFLHFQAAELRSYYESLTWSKKDRPTKFQLWAMHWSSDYGTEWTWGVWFTVIANFFFVTICSFDKDWNPHLDGVGYYLTGFFSSLFSLISVPKYFTTDWEIIWFYISRLFIAFGIYQTIAAFRKFGKSE